MHRPAFVPCLIASFALVACSSSDGDAPPDGTDADSVSDASSADALDGAAHDAPADDTRDALAPTDTLDAIAKDVGGETSTTPTCGPAAPVTGISPMTASWAHAVGTSGTTNDTLLTDVAVDADGNVYAVGDFKGTVSFGGAALVAKGTKDFFVAKYDRDGKHVFSRSFGDAGGTLWATRITIDRASGNVFVGGDWQNKTTISGTLKTTPDSSTDAWIGRVSSTDGSLVWARTFGGPNADDVSGLGVAPDGSVVVTGTFVTSVDLGAGTFTSAGNQDVFLAGYAAATGAPLWSNHYGKGGSEVFYDLAVDSTGAIFGVGSNEAGVTNFGGSDFTSPDGKRRSVFARYDDKGNHVWSKTFAGDAQSYLHEVSVGADGDLVVAGFFEGTKLDVDGCPLTSAGEEAALVAKFAPDGTTRWARALGGTGTAWAGALAVAVDAKNHVTVVTKFHGSVSFGGAPLDGPTTPYYAGASAIVGYGPDGAYEYAQAFPPTSTDSLMLWHVYAQAGGGVVVSGDFKGTAHVGSIDVTTTGTGTATPFLARFVH